MNPMVWLESPFPRQSGYKNQLTFEQHLSVDRSTSVFISSFEPQVVLNAVMLYPPLPGWLGSEQTEILVQEEELS